MKDILEFAVFRRLQNILETNFMTALDMKPESSVSLVAGGAVLAVVHIDLGRSHTVLSPNEARQFAAELKRIADMIDPLSQSR